MEIFRDFVLVVVVVPELTDSALGELADSVAAELGSPVPDFDWTSATSELLIDALTVTSSRKLLCVTG